MEKSTSERKNEMRKKKYDKVEAVARTLHTFIAQSTLSMYYSVIKLLRAENEEERSKAEDMINKMMTTGESLYEDLSDKQKELLKKLAQDVINICK